VKALSFSQYSTLPLSWLRISGLADQLSVALDQGLAHFHNTLNALARLVASISGLPPHFLGYATENPASVDGIRSSGARHIKRAERRQRSFGDGWNQVVQRVLHVRDGRVPDEALRVETQWVDAATPTFAAQADGVVKLYSADKLLPHRASRRALGYSDAQVRDRETEDQQALHLHQNENLFPIYMSTGSQPALRVSTTSAITDEQPMQTIWSDPGSAGRWGRRGLSLPTNPYLQTPDQMHVVAQSLLTDLADPVPVLADIPVTGDPRTQLGDQITVHDPDSIAGHITGTVIGIHRTLSTSDGLADSLTLRVQPRVSPV
jgi:hypothetical protein